MLAGCVMGSSIWRKSSYLVGREGSQVASELVTVVDDPLIRRAPGSRPYDGEGLPSRKNVVVEKGVLRTYLCDSYSARKLVAQEHGKRRARRSRGRLVQHDELHPRTRYGDATTRSSRAPSAACT